MYKNSTIQTLPVLSLLLLTLMSVNLTSSYGADESMIKELKEKKS